MNPLEQTVDPRKTAKRDGCAVVAERRPSGAGLRKRIQSSRRRVSRCTDQGRESTDLPASFRGTACDAVDLADGAQMVGQVGDAPDDAVQLHLPSPRAACPARRASESPLCEAPRAASAIRPRRPSSSSSWCSSPRRRMDSRRRSSGSSTTGRSGGDRRAPRWMIRSGVGADAAFADSLSSERSSPSSPAFNM